MRASVRVTWNYSQSIGKLVREVTSTMADGVASDAPAGGASGTKRGSGSAAADLAKLEADVQVQVQEAAQVGSDGAVLYSRKRGCKRVRLCSCPIITAHRLLFPASRATCPRR